MEEKQIDLLALSKSRRPGQGVSRIRSTTILHSGFSSTHIHGVAIVLSPQAQASWEAAGCVFIPTSERILSIRLKIHLGFATAIAVYAPTNPTNSTSEASAASVALLESLEARCSDLGLTISCKKTKLLAVVPSGSYPKPSRFLQAWGRPY